MKSRRDPAFRAAFKELPADVKRRAIAAYRLFKANPNHPSLQFKKVHSTKPVYSVRIGLYYRALGVRRGDVINWFWIGSHAEYDQLISNL
jgi:hypothetical protein